MKDKIIAVIAAYLDTKKVRSWRVNSVEEYLPQWPLEKATIAAEIAAAIEPLITKPKGACKEVVKGYEGDGLENMTQRDEIFYRICKEAIK